MDKTVSQLQLYQYFLRFFLPKGILDFFEPVWMETQSLDSRESKKDICIPGQKTDLAHPPPQMAYSRGVSDLPFFMYRLSTIFG